MEVRVLGELMKRSGVGSTRIENIRRIRGSSYIIKFFGNLPAWIC